MKYAGRVKNNIAFILLIVILSACSEKQVKVGVLMHGLENERWAKDRNYIVERIKELGAEPVVRIAKNNQDIQNSQAQQLLQEGVDVLIVVPVDQNHASPIVSMAHNNNVKVIAYDRLIIESDLDFFVTTNSVRVGEMQAEYMLSVAPQGKYAIIEGDKRDNNSLKLFLGQMNVLQDKIESNDIRIVYSEFTDSWSREESYRLTQSMFEHKDTADVIICGSDELAYGINTALEEAGILGQVKVISQDADLEIVRNIAVGNQTATIYKPLKKMAYKTAELAVEIAKGEEIERNYKTTSNGKRLVPSFLMEPKLVNKNTITSTVIADGYYSSEEIYQ